MQKLIAIIKIGIVLRFVGPSEWLFFLILPIISTVFLSGTTGGPADIRARLLVVDQARSPLSADLLKTLQTSDTVRLDMLLLNEAEEEFSDREAAALLIIPAGFTTESIRQGSVALDLRLLPNNTGSLMIEQTVNTAIHQVSSPLRTAANSLTEAERIRPFASEAERAAFFDNALQAARVEWAAAPDRLQETQAATPDPVDFDPQTNASAGQLITWVFIPLLGISGVFVYERQIGTLRRILVSPTEKGLYLLATILGQVLMALVQMALLVGFGAWVLKIDWGHSPAGLAAVLASGALAAAGIGTAMAVFVKSSGQANGLAVMSGMLMALLGGCWYPIELFPAVVQDLTRVLPTRWAMEGVVDLAVRGQDFAAVLPNVAVLLGFAAVFFAFGVWRFRYE